MAYADESDMEIRLDEVIAAPPEHVFQFFSDPRQRPRWQRSLSEVSMLTPGEPGLGTRWRESPGGLGAVTLEIVAYEPPRQWAERGSSALGELELTLRFTPEGTGTRVTLSATLSFPSVLWIGARLIKPLIVREIRNDMARAARILEHGERSIPET